MKVRLTIIIVFFSCLSGLGQHKTDSIVIKGKLFYREYKKDIPCGVGVRICYNSEYNVEDDHSLWDAVCNTVGEFEIKIPRDINHPVSLKYYFIGYKPIIINNIPVQKNIVQLGLLPLFDDTDFVFTDEDGFCRSRWKLFWRRIPLIRKNSQRKEMKKKERYRKHMAEYVYIFEGRSSKIDLKTNTIDLLTK